MVRQLIRHGGWFFRVRKYTKPQVANLTLERRISSFVYQVCDCGQHYIQMDEPPVDRIFLCDECGKLLALCYQGKLYEIGKWLL